MSMREKTLPIIVFFVLLALPVGIFLINRQTNLVPQAEFADGVFSFSPTQLSLSPGEEAGLELFLDTGEIKLSAVDLSFDFDKNIIQITRILEDPDDAFTDTIVKNISDYPPRLVLVSQKNTTDLASGKIKIATLIIKAVRDGQASFTVSPNEVVAFNGIQKDVRLNTGGDLTTAINIQKPLTPPQISFKTSLVGIRSEKNPPAIDVRLTIIDELIDPPAKKSQTVTLSADANNIFSPINSPVAFTDIPAGAGKTLLLKGPKHLQKKVGDRIELSSEKINEFDWTSDSLKLEPGDLPDPKNNYEQDGVVNANDVSLLIARIGSRDAVDLQVADLNYDGVVNANDLSLLIETLSTRYDDEKY